MIVQHFTANKVGRDFCIGDLHGMITLLNKFKEHVDFDPLVDRIFSVGDLIDRGEDSLACLKLLDEPWFHAVKANHEQMAADYLYKRPSGAYWYDNGGNWAFDYDDTKSEHGWYGIKIKSAEIARRCKALEDLPFLITVDLSTGEKVHIIHAEFPALTMTRMEPGSITDEVLANEDDVESMAKTHDGRNGDSFTWSRFLFGQFALNQLPSKDKIARSIAHRFHGSPKLFNNKLGHIYSGHSPVQLPLTLVGQTNLDTGAYLAAAGDRKWAALTAVNLATGEFYQTRADGVTMVEPLVITEDDIPSY